MTLRGESPFFWYFISDTGSSFIGQVEFQLAILLPWSPECWCYTHQRMPRIYEVKLYIHAYVSVCVCVCTMSVCIFVCMYLLHGSASLKWNAGGQTDFRFCIISAYIWWDISGIRPKFKHKISLLSHIHLTHSPKVTLCHIRSAPVFWQRPFTKLAVEFPTCGVLSAIQKVSDFVMFWTSNVLIRAMLNLHLFFVQLQPKHAK